MDQQRYKALFESTAVGIVLIDGERRIVDCNAAFCRILARPREDVLGKPATEFTVSSSGVTESRLDDLAAGDVDDYVIDRAFRRSDDTLVWTRITTSAMSPDDDLFVSIVEDTSLRHETERRLREQTALLSHAQQIAGVGSWAWYPNENRNEWSPEARRIYGISDEQAESGDPALFFDVIHPEDRDEILRMSWESFRTGRASSVEHRVRRADGDRWVRAQAEVECDEDGHPVRALGVVMDITDQKRTESELAEKAAVLARAHEVAKLGSFVVDVKTRRTHISAEAARILGCNEPFTLRLEEFRERFLLPEDRDAWATQLDTAYRRGEAYSLQQRMRCADGSTIWVQVHGSVELDEFDRPERAIGVVQDIGEQRRLGEQMRETQKMQAVGLLASGVAHDFNNLLLVIGANAQLALSSETTEVRPELEEILHATERGGSLIRQLLGFSKRSAAERHSIELNDMVRTVRRMLERLIDRSVEIDLELTGHDTTVVVDETRLEQALLNLAVNARDAMPQGGRITIGTESGADGIVLRVSDTGCGMDDATRERIFEPFFTTKSESGGTGLGLPTVYATVTECGGSVTIDSKPGLGTTFTLLLPHAPNSAVRPETNGTSNGSRKGGRVLLVEDDAMVRTVSAELLARAGYTVDAVDGGESALQRFTDGATYDAIVSDFMMPKMTGLQLNNELRRRGVELPVIYTSGYAASALLPPDGDRVRFVAKPFSGHEVAAALAALLDG
jgi:PAS domain S-box-containing protein